MTLNEPFANTGQVPAVPGSGLPGSDVAGPDIPAATVAAPAVPGHAVSVLAPQSSPVEAPGSGGQAERGSHRRRPRPEDRTISDSWLSQTTKALWAPLVLGIVIRLVLIPLTSWSKDDSVWWLASANGIQHLGLYQRSGFSYPPLSGDLLLGLGWLLQHAGVTTSGLGRTVLSLEPVAGTNAFSVVVTTPLFNLCFKGILLVLDLATGLLIYQLCRDLNASDQRARMAFCLWFLNPLVVLETGVFGAFDQLVAFLVLATVALFLCGRYFWCGLAIGLAVMAKGSPIFIVPLLLLVAAHRNGGSVGDRFRAVAPIIAGGLVAFAALTLPLVATHQVGASLHAMFARNGSSGGALYGGFGFLGFLSLRPLTSVADTLGKWSDINQVLLGLQLLTGIVFAVVAVRRAGRDLAHAVIGTTTLILAIVTMLMQTHPQYLLWFLPTLIVLVGVWRRGLLATVLFSLAGLAFVVLLYGPAAMIFPLASVGWVSAEGLNHAVLTWGAHVPAMFWSQGPGFTNLLVPLSIITLVALISLWRGSSLRRLPRRRRVADLPAMAMGGIVPVVTVLLVAATLSSVAVAVSTRGTSVNLSATTTTNGLHVSADVQTGASLQQLRLVAFPTANATVPQAVDIYRDPKYPVIGTTDTSVGAIVDTLTNELQLRGYNGTIRTVDAAQLATVMQSTATAPATAVVDVSGVLPQTVYSPRTDQVLTWLHAGGTLYWGGAPPGYFNVRRGESVTQTLVPNSFDAKGLAGFYPTDLYQPLSNSYAVGTDRSAAAEALGLVYRFNQLAPISGSATGGPTTSGLTGQGWESRQRSSLTVVSEGQGQLVQLGGLVYNERLVGPDLSLLIMSGITRTDGTIAYANVPTRIVQQGGRVSWTPTTAPAPNFVVIALDPSTGGVVFERTVLQS